MEEDYTAGAQGLGDDMEHSEMDCTKLGPTKAVVETLRSSQGKEDYISKSENP